MLDPVRYLGVKPAESIRQAGDLRPAPLADRGERRPGDLQPPASDDRHEHRFAAGLLAGSDDPVELEAAIVAGKPLDLLGERIAPLAPPLA